MIIFNNLSKWYSNNTIKALQNVNVKIKKSDFVFLHGPSGSGKTTFMNLILCAIAPTSGDLFVDKMNLNKIKKCQIPVLRRKIGTIFQDFKILYNKTVYENVSYIMHIMNINKTVIKNKTEKVLRDVGLWYKKNQFPHKLSGGEQQKIAIARALVNSPQIILADEPTGNLDSENADKVMELLYEINIRGTTLIIATHNSGLVKKENHRILKLDKGILTEI
jgi:cell division transport system ATP-binding protein